MMFKIKQLWRNALLSLKKEIGWQLFSVKYKMGKAVEGVDFFTCGEYTMCKECSHNGCLCFSNE